MAIYAKNTTVSPEKTLSEIQSLLKKYKADKFGYAEDSEQIKIGFAMSNRMIRFTLILPQLKDFELKTYGRYSENQRIATYEQAIRQRWRALLLTIQSET